MWLKQKFGAGKFGLLWALWVVGFLWALHIAPAHAAAPLAGTIITNQASASYLDNGATHSVTSNTVESRVTEKQGLVLTQDNAKLVAPGGTAYFPHTVTNTGNVSDSFNLRMWKFVGDSFVATCSVFADANGDGQPDNAASPLTLSATGPCTSDTAAGGAGLVLGPVAAGQSYNFIIAVQARDSAVVGDLVTLRVDAQSTTNTAIATAGLFSPTATVTAAATSQNTDTATVSNAAVFEVIKSVDKATVFANGSESDRTLTYTLTVKNIGAAPGSVKITDDLSTPASSSLTYLTSSPPEWSAGVPITLGTPATDRSGATLDYNYDNGRKTVTATFANMQQNRTYTLTFKVLVNLGVQTGSDHSKNQVKFECVNAISCPVGARFSNTVVTTVNPAYGVVASAKAATLATAGKDTVPGTPLASANDTNTWSPPSAPAGSTVSFENKIWNTGNTPDSFVIGVFGDADNTFPAGTLVQHFQADGLTPLLANNTTPVVAPEGHIIVVTKVTLPGSAAAKTVASTLVVRATSVGDARQFDAVRERLDSITAATLILSNDPAGLLSGVDSAASTCTVRGSQAEGSCTDRVPPVGTPPASTSIASAGKAVFPLYIKSSSSGSFTLTASATTGDAFAGGVLPAGWSVQFFPDNDGNCRSHGTSAVTSVNVSAAETSTHVACAVVTPPAGAAATTVPFYFRATNSSGLTSTVYDAVTIAAQSSFSFSPSHAGQVSPGGSVVYSHILANTGNSDLRCTSMDVRTTRASGAASGWSSVVYLDVNNNGALDNTELTPVTSSFNGAKFTNGDTPPASTTAPAGGVLPVGKAVRYFVKVSAPSGTAVGSSDQLTVTATPRCGTEHQPDALTIAQSVFDVTTVTGASLRLQKTQAKPISCTTTTTTPLEYKTGQLSVQPGECICYNLTVTNEGAVPVSRVKISDSTPSLTTYSPTPVPASCSSGTIVPPSSGQAGVVKCDFDPEPGTLAAGATATMNFCVKVVDQ